MKLKSLKKKFEKKLKSPNDSLDIISKSSARDHFMYSILFKKKIIGIFQISMGTREPGKTLIGLMARQLGISSEEVKGIENCTFWGADFVKKSSLIETK